MVNLKPFMVHLLSMKQINDAKNSTNVQKDMHKSVNSKNNMLHASIPTLIVWQLDEDNQCGSVFWTAHNHPWCIYATPFFECEQLAVSISDIDNTIHSFEIPYQFKDHKDYWTKNSSSRNPSDREMILYIEFMVWNLPLIIQRTCDHINGIKSETPPNKEEIIREYLNEQLTKI